MSCNYRVAFLGNFGAPFSTESDLSWSLEQLGWHVTRLQENTTTTDEILAASLGADFWIWVHTHGWKERGSMSMDDVLAKLKERNVPTIGIHMDRYWSIPEREEMMRTHPFFRCSQLWTADGGNQDKFAALGIDHHWFPPAICLKYCWIGTPREQYECDVVFVGSKYYHPEYPFRTRLVEWLDKPHSFSVKRWGGDRPGAREELNDIYASCKVVVGDSMFAGADHYWSDRTVEVIGRCGFLTHPASEGMNFTGMAAYKPEDLVDLENVILYYLDNPEKRREMQMAGFEWVKKNHTWHNRLLLLLNHLGFN